MSTTRLPEWRFDALLQEGMALVRDPDSPWTNHNAADPGITLLELLAYFTEMLVYRLSRVSPDARLQLLRLLHGRDWGGWKPLVGATGAAIDAAFDAAVAGLAQSDCAVTAADFEARAVAAAEDFLEQRGAVRALCLPPSDAVPGESGPSVVTVVVVPDVPPAPDAAERLRGAVLEALRPHCLLTTRVRVISPSLLHVAIGMRLSLRRNATRDAVVAAVERRLAQRFSAATAAQADTRGPTTRPPLGAPLDLGAIEAEIDAAEGVEQVQAVFITHVSHRAETLFDAESRIGVRLGLHSTPGLDARLGVPAAFGADRLLRDDSGGVSGMVVHPWEVVRLQVAASAVQIVGSDIDGRAEGDPGEDDA